MIPDIYINDVSMLKMGWIRENVEFPIPESQTEAVVVPGRNAPIRFSEALGMVSFKPRAFTITLSMLGTRSDFDEKVKIMSNQYAGRLCKVRKSEELSLYAVGTLQLTPSYVITTADTTLSWKIAEDSFRKTLSAGEWELPELQLTYGENAVKVEGSGMTTFRYREGCL